MKFTWGAPFHVSAKFNDNLHIKPHTILSINARERYFTYETGGGQRVRWGLNKSGPECETTLHTQFFYSELAYVPCILIFVLCFLDKLKKLCKYVITLVSRCLLSCLDSWIIDNMVLSTRPHTHSPTHNETKRERERDTERQKQKRENNFSERALCVCVCMFE